MHIKLYPYASYDKIQLFDKLTIFRSTSRIIDKHLLTPSSGRWQHLY